MMQVFVLSVCVTEIEIKCRDIVERPRSVGTESSSSSSSVCVAMQYSHSATRWHSSQSSSPEIVSEEVKLCQQLFGMMLIC